MPRCSDSATFSAACRHTLQVRNKVSPSFHSPLCRSYVRGVEASRKLATAAPDGVKRSSGSSTRLPTSVMTVSPAMNVSLSFWRRWLAGVGADDFSPQHRLVQGELAVELLDDRRLTRQVEDRVDAFGLLFDVV